MEGNLANPSRGVHSARLARLVPLTADVVALDLELAPEEASLAWRPGQFISLRCGESPDGTPLLRSFSIASSPGDSVIRLVVKLIREGAAYAWLNRLSPGSPVEFGGPMGFFVLDLQHAGDVVFAATGTGIAPVVPMVRELLLRNEKGRVFLRWGLRSERELFWREELAQLAHHRFGLGVCLTQPGPSWAGMRGRVTPAVLTLLPQLVRPTFYLVGNGAMIRELKEGLVVRGVDRKRQIRTEAFFA